MPKFTEHQIITAAQELNAPPEQGGLGLHDPDPPYDDGADAVADWIVEGAQFVEPADDLTDETWKVVNAANSGTLAVQAETETEEEPEPDTPDEEEDEAEAVETVEDLLVLVNSTSKLPDLKEVAGEFEEFDALEIEAYSGLQGTRQLKNDMVAVLQGEEPTEPSPKKEKKKKKKGKKKKTTYTTSDAVMDAIDDLIQNNTSASAKEIAETAKTLYEENTKAHLKSTRYIRMLVTGALTAVTHHGIVQKSGRTYSRA